MPHECGFSRGNVKPPPTFAVVVVVVAAVVVVVARLVVNRKAQTPDVALIDEAQHALGRSTTSSAGIPMPAVDDGLADPGLLEDET